MKNKILTGLLLVLIGGWGSLSAQNVGSNYARQVNTLIGTKGVGLTSGYLYPGATYPYGMVQFTPSYFSKRSGFVINQLSGGGCEHMGNFPTFPVKGKLKMSPDNILNYRINISEEKGHAGYYEAKVQEDIHAKLTVTERTGMASYEYPADQQYGTVIIGGGISATPIEQAAIVITAPNKCEGYAEGGNFCGLRTPYKVYFVAEFDTDALESGTWKRDELKPNTTFAEGEYSGVYFTFDVNKKKNIQYKIGVSYVSVENARENLKAENTGWLQSRNPDGSWKPLTEDFRESTYKNYFWMVPYDIAGLIEIIGGKAAAEKRLDEFFTRLDAGYNDAWFASGNEPSFHIPWIYNWVGTPYKAQEIINRVLNEQYSSKIDGLPGNDDLGTMGAWYVFACIGLYPEIPGVGGFTVNTPIFSSVKIHLKKGDMVIKGGSEKNIYIKSMKLNGKPYDSTWIDWDQLNNGATIEYTTSSKPDVKWGTKVTPPSFP